MNETQIRSNDKTLRRFERLLGRADRSLWILSVCRFLSFGAMAGGAVALAMVGFPFQTSALAAVPGFVAFLVFFFLYFRRRDAATALRNVIAQRSIDLMRQQPDWWKNPADATTAYAPPENHPYAADLHITGNFSIGRLMDRTTVPGARRVLYDLLLGQPDLVALDGDAWQARRDAIHELSTRRVWQSRMRRAGRTAADAHIFEDQDLLPSVSRPPLALALLAWILPVVSMSTWIGVQYDALPAWYLIAYPVQLLIFVFGLVRYKKATAVFSASADLYADYARVFKAAEFRFHSRLLSVDSFQQDHAYRRAGRLSWIATLFSLRRNPVLYFLAGTLFLSEIHAGFLAANWIERYGFPFSVWVREVRRLDAWMSFAIFERNHPDWSAPQLARDASTVFAAQGAGHPLVPPATRVSNAITFAGDSRLWLIAGSNMSGKSTLLRTAGVNLILAMAGSVVCAEKFLFQPIRVVTSLNVADDLAQSVSLFYAEVRRIKMVLDAAADSKPPLFFLLDEILRGTNAGERHTAVRSIVLDLLELGARGMLSTHDTALLDISREQPGVEQYHFQEKVKNGKMVFDYRMMPGPPSGSNALAVLREEGIRIR